MDLILLWVHFQNSESNHTLIYLFLLIMKRNLVHMEVSFYNFGLILIAVIQ